MISQSTLTNTNDQHLLLVVDECITQPARTRNTISIWIWMPYEVTRILLPPGPPSFLPFSLSLFLFLRFFLYSSLSFPVRSCFLPVHECGWSTCNGKQRASREERRWLERWPREREGEGSYGAERKMMLQEEERGGWMRVCEMASDGCTAQENIWRTRTEMKIHAEDRRWAAERALFKYIRLNNKKKCTILIKLIHSIFRNVKNLWIIYIVIYVI